MGLPIYTQPNPACQNATLRIKRYVLQSCLAHGLVILLAIAHTIFVWPSYLTWLLDTPHKAAKHSVHELIHPKTQTKTLYVLLLFYQNHCAKRMKLTRLWRDVCYLLSLSFYINTLMKPWYLGCVVWVVVWINSYMMPVAMFLKQHMQLLSVSIISGIRTQTMEHIKQAGDQNTAQHCSKGSMDCMTSTPPPRHK